MILFRGGGGSVIYRAKLPKIIPIYTSNLKKNLGGGGWFEELPPKPSVPRPCL